MPRELSSRELRIHHVQLRGLVENGSAQVRRERLVVNEVHLAFTKFRQLSVFTCPFYEMQHVGLDTESEAIATDLAMGQGRKLAARSASTRRRQKVCYLIIEPPCEHIPARSPFAIPHLMTRFIIKNLLCLAAKLPNCVHEAIRFHFFALPPKPNYQTKILNIRGHP